MNNATIKTSRYQVIPAERLARYERPRLALRWERNKMKNPVYYRLVKEGRFVGFKRIVTEYLPAAEKKWQLDPVDHAPEETQKLSQPAVGTATLPRQNIVTTKQRRVTPTEVKASGLGICLRAEIE